MSTDTRLLRAVVANPDFRHLLSVRLIGQFSDGLFTAALFSAVFFNPERATSAGEAATGFATLLLPYSIVGPFAGVFLDRWRRQRVLRNGNLVRAALIVVFASLLAALGPTALPVVAIALVVVSVNRFILSGLSAALPKVVAPQLLVTANSFSTTLGGGAAATGGGVAVALRIPFGADDIGAGRIALVAVALYLVAALVAGRIDADRLGPDIHTPLPLRTALLAVARGVREGSQHVREHGQAARGLAAITAHRFFYGLSFVTTLLLYTAGGAVGLGFAGLGQVISVSVLGGLLAALVTPAVTRRVGTQFWVVAVFAVAAVVEVAFGLPFTHPAILVAAFFLGFVAQASKICVDTLVQESVLDAYRGRVFSFYDTMFNVSFVSAAAASAVLLPPDGKSYVVIGLIAVGYAITALLYGTATARAAGREPPEPIVAAGAATGRSQEADSTASAAAEPWRR